MGKKQHSKDKLYITPLEYRNEFGGKKERGPFVLGIGVSCRADLSWTA